MRVHDLLRPMRWVPCAALLPVLAFVLLTRPPQAGGPPARLTPASIQEQDLERQVERFAFNALLVPMLDDSDDAGAVAARHAERRVAPAGGSRYARLGSGVQRCSQASGSSMSSRTS